MTSSASKVGGSGLVKTVEIEGRGRALVASQSLRGGQIILTDSPILLYSAHPLSSSSNAYCSNCFRHLQTCSTLVSCSSCPCLFCSPDCLTDALSSSHSPWACLTLSLLRASPSLSLSHSERQVQARFLVAAYNLAIVSPSHFHILLSLQGMALPSSDSDAPTFLHSLLSSLSPPQGVAGFSVELTTALLAKDKLNAFGLMEPPALAPGGERSVRAYGIYPKASFFNHDCLPNACRFDYVDTASHHNTDITIRLIHDVPEGSEICLSYFPVNETYADRQKRLLEDYGFTCYCDRCRVEANWKDDDEQEEEQDDEGQVMDEDQDEQMIGSENEIEIGDGGGENDFPHAYFFLRYMCTRENCWGTLAPLPPSDSDASPSNLMECNVCGNSKKSDEDFNSDEDRLSVDD